MEITKDFFIKQITSHMTVHAEKGKTLQQNGRKSYGLSLCTSGQITYTMDDRRYISTPEVAVLLPEGATYSLHTDKAGLFPLINFHCGGLTQKEIAVIPVADPAACLGDYERISQLLRSDGRQLEALSVFYSLLARLFSPRKTDFRLSPAIEYMEVRLSDPALCNRQLADALGISEVYLRKLFLVQLGTTPRQYLLELRLQKARQLLLDTPMTVTAIAEACGFSSVYHFCRAFKEKIGSTPTQYARQNRDFKL